MTRLGLKVRCYSGYRGEQTPVSIQFRNNEIHVTAMIDMWLDPDHRYFKFTGSDNGIYIIRHDTNNHFWELVFYDEKPLVSR